MKGGETLKEIIQILVRYAKILNSLLIALNDGTQQDCRSLDKYNIQLPIISFLKKSPQTP